MDEKDGKSYDFKIDSQTELTSDITLFNIKNGKKQSLDHLIVAKDNHNL
jgi:hypothetical protein